MKHFVLTWHKQIKNYISKIPQSLILTGMAAFFLALGGCSVCGPTDTMLESRIYQQMEFNRRTTGNPYSSLDIFSDHAFIMYRADN